MDAFLIETDGIDELSAQLIRDSCICHECRDALSGQRLKSILELEPNLEIKEINEDEDSVTFVLSDGHHVTLDGQSVEDLILEMMPLNWRGQLAKTMWLKEDAPQAIFQWGIISTDDAKLYEMLDQLISYGFAVIGELPNKDRAVLDVIHTFGYERVTNYGDIFDVRVVEGPNNLAFTNLAIAPHTDNPYRDPVPTIQLLHCLESTVEGGLSGLVDGFRAATLLRENDPKNFEILSTRLFQFEYKNPEVHLSVSAPIIKTDAMDEIVEIRWNDRSMQPPFNGVDINEVYEALRAFARILNDPANLVQFKLQPGECIIFDNSRVLHARTGFETNGNRHLQGAYADLDSAISRWSILQDKLDI